jgi:hypothetical protein
LEHLGWQIILPSVVLAPFTGAYYLGGISYGSGPVEALPERISNKGAWCSMMAAHASVDVLKQLSPLLDGNAALQDSSGAPPVEFLIHQDECLGSAHEATGLGPVGREDSVD